jgi:hypothetical protein
MKTRNTVAILALLGLFVTALAFRPASRARASNLSSADTNLTAIPQPPGAPDRRVGQLDPGVRNYVLKTFTINTDSLDVMVTKTASSQYLAGKEYWNTNPGMLGAIAGATSGTSMTISGVSHNWPAPTGFASNFRMQAPVTWGTASAPSGLSWVYSGDTGTNTYVCIEFNLSGSAGNYSVSSIRWYLAAKSAPRSGTYVFPAGTRYSLSYANAPALPNGTESPSTPDRNRTQWRFLIFLLA